MAPGHTEDDLLSTVEHFMNPRVISRSSNDSVLDIAKNMVESKISSIVIIDRTRKKVVGILTERDVVKIIASGVPPGGITAGSLMSSPVVSVSKDSSIEKAACLMVERKVRHLLVENENSQLAGIITVTDLAKYLMQRVIAKEDVDKLSEAWELFF